MNSGIVWAVLLGFAAVLQGISNRYVSIAWGHANATMLNMTITVVLAGLYVMAVRTGTVVELGFAASDRTVSFSWWWLIPGLLGFFIVAGIPYAIEKIGAGTAFILMVAGQVIFSIGWDWFRGEADLSPSKIVAAVLVIVAALLAAP